MTELAADAPVVYRNAKAFTADPDRPWAPAFAVHGGRFLVAGCLEEVQAVAAKAAASGAVAGSGGGVVEEVDLKGNLVLPGVIDAHFHLMGMGESLQRVDLVRARSLEEIQRLVREHAVSHSQSHWVLGKSWLFDAIPGGEPTVAMLDAVVPIRPVLLDANDYHSTWVNSLGLDALGITDSTPDPAGGRIARDASGRATGFLEETAAELAWAHLDRVTTGEGHRQHLRGAIAALHAAGVTTVIDMGLGATSLQTIVAAEADGELDLRVVGHWLMSREGSSATHLAQVSEAVELTRVHTSDRFRMTGIKFIVDGVIDGCTAHVSEPYTTGAMPDPIWDYEALVPVVAAADKAGIQVALHAIGDAAVRAALDAIENAYRENGTGPDRIGPSGSAERRHRIEHIEYCDPADISRFAALGVTASMQPVHADPAIQDNWRAMLGPERSPAGFPAAALVASGARLVLGTDAPTAPYAPLPNLFIATTRRSAMDPSLPANQPKNALPLHDAITYATANAAWSCFAEDRLGSIAPGRHADFFVVDPDVTDSDPDRLLDASVLQTLVGGRTVHRKG
ncbi:MAG: amidohydrolase family protein [Actinomycetia bacterium]|nr:amidohydrolase family protein [Actinomycetes bacterium]